MMSSGSGHDIIVGTQSDDTVYVGGSNSGNYTTNNQDIDKSTIGAF